MGSRFQGDCIRIGSLSRIILAGNEKNQIGHFVVFKGGLVCFHDHHQAGFGNDDSGFGHLVLTDIKNMIIWKLIANRQSVSEIKQGFCFSRCHVSHRKMVRAVGPESGLFWNHDSHFRSSAF